jgi:prepilin-type N-terminal cleavage/methylation domain-containing protein
MKAMNSMPRHHNISGFTLIEMLVAVALFSIVLLISLGSIMTIVDVNKKSQTLTTVMNELNFTLENMTRSMKTGTLQLDPGDSGDYPVITVQDQDKKTITYKFEESSGQITRQLGSGTPASITSDQITITNLIFRVFYDAQNRQPRVLILVSGTASVGESISSDFTIQTSVSQRDLETDNFK